MRVLYTVFVSVDLCSSSGPERLIKLDPAAPSFHLEPRKGPPMTGGWATDSRTQLYLADLPVGVDKNDIFNLFSPFGHIEDISIPINKKTGERKSFGFVHFANNYAAQRAMAVMNGHHFPGGNTLRVSFPARSAEEASCPRVYIEGLQPFTTEDDIKNLFPDFKDDIRFIRVPSHNINGKATVSFSCEARAKSFIGHFNGLTSPKPLRISRWRYPKPKVEADDPSNLSILGQPRIDHPDWTMEECMPFFVGQASSPHLSSSTSDDLWKLDDLASDDSSVDDLLTEIAQSEAELIRLVENENLQDIETFDFMAPTKDPGKSMTTSPQGIRGARHIKDSSGHSDDPKTTLIRILQVSRKKNSAANRREEFVQLIFLEHRLFKLAKSGDFNELLRIEKWLFNAYSIHRVQVFTSAYRRLLNDSYEFPKELINTYKDGMAQIEEYYSKRQNRMSTLGRVLEKFFDKEYPNAGLGQKGALLEVELHEMAIRNDWNELQYALDILKEARIGKGMIALLFKRVYKIVKQ